MKKMKFISSILVSFLITIAEGFIEPPPSKTSHNPPLLCTRPYKSFEKHNKFESIRNKKSFVDRTHFLVDFINDFNHPKHPPFITAPSTFCKTTTLHMIDAFFRNETYPNGTIISNIKDHSHYKTFQDTVVFGNRSFVQNYFGKYPVLKIDMKQDRKVIDRKTLVKSLLSSLTESAAPYLPILSPVAEEFTPLPKILAGDYRDVPGDDLLSLLNHGTFMLMSGLRYVFDQKLFILADNVDYPAVSILDSSVSETTIMDIHQTYGDFLSQLFKNNGFLHAGFLTGRVSYWALSYPTANIRRFHFTQTVNLASTFGLTLKDVGNLIKRYNPSNVTPEKLREEFDGYIVQGSEMKVLSTISVIESIESNQIKPVWSDNISARLFYKAFDFKLLGETVEEATKGKPIDAYLEGKISLNELLNLKSILSDLKKFGTKIAIEYPSIFWQYLYELGYFVTENGASKGLLRLFIANKEVKRILAEDLSRAVCENAKISESVRLGFKNALLQLDSSSMNKFQKFVNSIQDVFVHILDKIAIERNVHSYLFVIVQNGINENVKQQIYDWKVGKNETVPDLILPFSETDTGMVIDVSYEDTASGAMKQIHEKQFAQAISKFKNKIYVGLNFNPYKKKFSAAFLVNEDPAKWEKAQIAVAT